MLLSRKVQSCAAMSFAAAMISASFVFAKEPEVTNSPGSAMQNYRAKQILGAKVNIQGDASVGVVDDIVLDEHGNVDYLIVANKDGKLVTVPWDAAAFNVEKRMATVQITPEKFNQIPTYTAQQYPVYSTPAYRTQTYQYYGLTPGQNRRMIRSGAAIVR